MRFKWEIQFQSPVTDLALNVVQANRKRYRNLLQLMKNIFASCLLNFKEKGFSVVSKAKRKLTKILSDSE